jgi:glycosyltransferase involved in cell wall biosynthesis
MFEAVSGLRDRGVEVHTVLPSPGVLADDLTELGIPVHIIPYAWWVGYDRGRRADYRLKRLGRNIYFFNKLYRLLKKINPDVVVSNTLTIPAGAFAARRAGIPHIWYVHEFGQRDHGLYFDLGESLSLFLMNKLSARIIVNSKAVLEHFKSGLPVDKLRLVYQAVEVPPQPAGLEQESGTLRLIQVGNLTPEKRQEDAIRALAILIKKGHRLRLTLLGQDARDYGRELRDLSEKLEVSQHVDFVAFNKEPFSYFEAADIALMCSKSEAFGRVTIEAMKLGKAVVGANSAGTAELILNGETGLIFQMGDFQDLGRKIEILYHDRQLLREMGRRAQAWATQTFTSENYARGLLEVFQEAMKREPRLIATPASHG